MSENKTDKDRLTSSTEVEPAHLESFDIRASLRDLLVYLHRGNAEQAREIVVRVSAYLEDANANSSTSGFSRIEQTTFAIEEVRLLLAERDFKGAVAAARDAAKEWSHAPDRLKQ